MTSKSRRLQPVSVSQTVWFDLFIYINMLPDAQGSKKHLFNRLIMWKEKLLNCAYIHACPIARFSCQSWCPIKFYYIILLMERPMPMWWRRGFEHFSWTSLSEQSLVSDAVCRFRLWYYISGSDKCFTTAVLSPKHSCHHANMLILQ